MAVPFGVDARLRNGAGLGVIAVHHVFDAVCARLLPHIDDEAVIDLPPGDQIEFEAVVGGDAVGMKIPRFALQDVLALFVFAGIAVFVQLGRIPRHDVAACTYPGGIGVAEPPPVRVVHDERRKPVFFGKVERSTRRKGAKGKDRQ